MVSRIQPVQMPGTTMKLNFRSAAWGVLPLIALVVAGPVAQSQEKAGAAANLQLQIPETDEGLPGAGPIRRADWFKKLWIDRRTAWANRRPEDEGGLVFLGVSTPQ